MQWTQKEIEHAFKMLQHLAQQVEAKPQTFSKVRTNLAAKDKQTLKKFARMGIKTNVVLMDRTDRSKPFNVKPFKAWLTEGRVVRKGQHGVNGLFHITQTDKLPSEDKAKATPASAKPKLTLKSFSDLSKVANDDQPTA